MFTVEKIPEKNWRGVKSVRNAREHDHQILFRPICYQTSKCDTLKQFGKKGSDTLYFDKEKRKQTTTHQEFFWEHISN